jgi:hypothetical protein
MRDQDRRDHVPDEADEAALEAGLRDAAARFDPVPAELIQAAVAAFSWRTADAELAALAFDSLLDQPGDALVRSAGGPRLLSFRRSGPGWKSGTGPGRTGSQRMILAGSGPNLFRPGRSACTVGSGLAGPGQPW